MIVVCISFIFGAIFGGFMAFVCYSLILIADDKRYPDMYFPEIYTDDEPSSDVVDDGGI
jgi:hypothetical protein